MRKAAATPTTRATTDKKQRQYNVYPPLIEAVLVLALLVIWTVGGLAQ
jgi:hypothetical protein